MGIYTGEAPRGTRPLGQPPASEWPREQQIAYHCRCEARLEVESWFTGDPHQYRPFDRRYHIPPYCYRTAVLEKMKARRRTKGYRLYPPLDLKGDR
jgi:hypothetical protein